MSKSNNSCPSRSEEPQKLKHERKTVRSFEDTALLVLGLLSALMLGISLFTLNTETGPLANLKVVLVTTSASLAAYGINRVSIKKLAPRAAIGFRLAAVVAVFGIFASGVGMFVGSFSGIVYPDIQYRVLEENGEAQSDFIRLANDSSLVAQRILPIIQETAGSIARTATCEAATSCLSQQGSGGRGEIAIGLEGHAQRAQAIADAMDRGSIDREEILQELNDLSGRYQHVLGEADQNISSKRADLQGLHAEIQQAASALREALPLTLLASFAEDLRTGATVPGNPVGSQRLSAFLRGEGEAIYAALRDIPEVDLTPPPFPARPGMLDTLRYIADFAAIAAVIGIAELCLPMALFVTSYLALVWEIEKRTPPNEGDDRSDPWFDGLIDLPPKPNGGVGAIHSNAQHFRDPRDRT
jgi:hypothetical protein